MLPFAPALAAASLFLTVADNVPHYDVKPTCRAAIEMMGSQGRTVDSCMRSENEARADVVKHWPQTPKDEQQRCAQTALHSGSPSYVELLICIEMHRDSRNRAQQLKDEQAKAKQEQAAAAKAKVQKTGAKPSSQ
jgi:hypothetical protein